MHHSHRPSRVNSRLHEQRVREADGGEGLPHLPHLDGALDLAAIAVDPTSLQRQHLAAGVPHYSLRCLPGCCVGATFGTAIQFESEFTGAIRSPGTRTVQCISVSTNKVAG